MPPPSCLVLARRASRRGALSLALVAPAALSAAPEARPLPFERLSYSARAALVLDAEVSVQARLERADVAASRLRSCPEGLAVPPSGDAVVVLESRVEGGFGRPAEATAWLDPARGGALLQELAVRPGRRWRLRRLTEDGHHVWVRRPGTRDERADAGASGSAGRDEHVTWEAAEALPSAAAAVLWHAADPALHREGARRQLVVVARDRPVVAELVAGGTESVRLSARVVRGASVTRERRRVVARRLRVTVEEPSQDLRLLGLDHLELLVDEETGLVVLLRGRAPVVGTVSLRLQEARCPASRTPHAPRDAASAVR